MPRVNMWWASSLRSKASCQASSLFSRPTFADDLGVGHALRVADIGDVIDDVVGVFLEAIVGGAVESRAAAVVIHAQAAADVDVLEGETHLVELGVITGGLLNGLFHRENVRHLRA